MISFSMSDNCAELSKWSLKIGAGFVAGRGGSVVHESVCGGVVLAGIGDIGGRVSGGGSGDGGGIGARGGKCSSGGKVVVGCTGVRGGREHDDDTGAVGGRGDRDG